MGLFELVEGQGGPLEFAATKGLVAMNDYVYDVEKEIEDGDGKVDNERNAEQQAFMGLSPSGDVDDDNVFSVGAESQISDSTPQAPDEPVLNLQQQLTILCTLRDSLKRQILAKGDEFFQWLSGHFHGMKIYGNHPLVAGPEGQSMLVPMLSFYGIATKDMIPNIKLKTSIESITTNIKTIVRRLFTTPIRIPEVDVDCPEPSGTNLVWNVRLTLNGNIFTLLTFRVVAMTNTDFPPQAYPLSPENLYMLLCFALLSKACAKDFNCLCGMPDIDVQLFKSLSSNTERLREFARFVQHFLDTLAEPQLDSKKSYMITALHNLVANSVDTSQTGETLAYKMLFDGNIESGVSGSGAHTFNPIMRQIAQLIQMLRPQMELQVSLCGGRMIYKLGEVLRTRYNVTSVVSINPLLIACLGGVNAEALVAEMVKPLNIPSDADLTLTFAGRAGALDPGYIQTLLMFFTLCCQLGVKKITDDFCISSQFAELFLREPAVIGMSLVGGDFQLSSARSSCNAMEFLSKINRNTAENPNPLFTEGLSEFLQQFPLGENRLTKSALAEFDLVPKMASGDYIVKISHYIFDSDYTGIAIPANIGDIADKISRYSMSTDEGFSSPVKVLFDIFFTLFSIENFTNRAFVTQKINKELKRIGICASILFFHFNELLQMPYPEGSQQRINELLQAQQSYQEGSLQRQLIDTELLQFQQRLLYPEGSPQRREITTMLEILGRVINYGYNPAFKLLSAEIDNIMTAYASCFVQLLHLYHLDVVFYSRVPQLPTPTSTFPPVGPRTTLTSLETACREMIHPTHVRAEAEGLLHPHLQLVVKKGVEFLSAIQENGILTQLLQIKERVKTEDLTYKAQGKFLTSVEAFDLFLRYFVPMLLLHSPLVAQLDQLLEIFRSPDLNLAELMRFQPVVVVKSENLRNPGADPQGLKVTGEYQFGVYVILSIFGVKFKSEWSKISLFTRMLFYQLLSRADAMHGVCSSLLGVDLKKVDPSKMRVSSENFMKDQALFEAIQQCGIMPVLPAPLQTYYGNDKLRHGIDTYKNSLLDTRQVTHSFIQPIEYDTDEDVLSFQFLNSVNLQQLMACQPDGPLGAPPGEVFQRLLPDGFQPRAYEFLLQRLTDKFSILTKECDDNAKIELLALGHYGRPKKELKREFKVQGFDAFIDSFVYKLLGAGLITPEQFTQIIFELISSPNNAYAACFEGEEVDISKFRELAPDQCKYWIYHLLEMIMFYHNLSMMRVDLGYLCVENIKKYSKLLFLLKKYLPIDHAVVQAAVQQAAVQQAAMQQAAMQQVAMQQAAIKEASRQQAALPPPASALLPPPPASALPPPPPASALLPPLMRGIGANLIPSRRDASSRRRDASPGKPRNPSPGKPQNPSPGKPQNPSRGRGRSRSPGGSIQGGGSPKVSATKPKTRNNRYSKNARTRKNNHNHKHKRKQHRNRKYKKTTNTKSNRRTKSKSKKNVTFKRRRRSR
jgi:hypothetical protein